MAYLNIINDLGWYDITAVYYRLVNDPRFPDGYPESYWDVNRIYHEGPLEPGEEITFEVEQDLYDVRCISLSRHPGDPDRHYHTRYGADITQDGYTWEVTRDDEDE